jgi:hypothetical protein
MRACARATQSNYSPQCHICEGLWPFELHVHTQASACVHSCAHVRVCACAYVCACVVYVCACVYGCVRTCACVVYLYVYMCVHAYVCACGYVFAHRWCVHAHVKELKTPFLLVSFLPKRGPAPQAVCPPWGP